MASDLKTKVGAYITDGVRLLRVMTYSYSGALTARKTHYKCEDAITGMDVVIEEASLGRWDFVCMEMTDDECYRRFKAIGKEWTAEPGQPLFQVRPIEAHRRKVLH